MHTIKRSAHQAAWFSKRSDSVRTYNIFGRFDTRPKKVGDVENQLNHPATENNAVSPVEDKRRSTAAAENGPFAGPTKSNTYAGTSNHLDVPASQGSAVMVEKPRELESEDNTAERTNSAPAASVEHTVTSTSASGTRKRSGRRAFFDKFSSSHNTEDASTVATADDEEDNKKNRPKLTFMSQFKAVFASPINILLVFVPVGIALEYVHVNKIIVFVINFIAIIPLAAMLSYSTEELAMYIGEVLGGLLNATFGNAVELIVSIIALTQGKTLIVQTSLVGSMLSNLLLVLGMCMAAGGFRRQEQHFNITVAQTAASLLALAIGSLIIPTAFQMFTNNQSNGITELSHGTAVILLFVYACYLLFQLRTHVTMYNAPSEKTPKNSSSKKSAGEAKKGIAAIAGLGAAAAGGQINRENIVQDEDDEETPQLTRVGAVVTLAISTVFIALCAEYMVSAIGTVGEHISQEFIGLILLPIVGNAAEHATAVTVAIKDKMDLSIGVAVGSSLQIALLVLPVMICLSWWGVGAGAAAAAGVGELTLSFDGFQVSALFIAIIIVNYVVQDGKSNWLEGTMLQATYLIIAVAAYFYTPPAGASVAG